MVKTGNSVVIKPDMRDVDFDVDIGGWQGRIVEIKSEEQILAVHWGQRHAARDARWDVWGMHRAWAELDDLPHWSR